MARKQQRRQTVIEVKQPAPVHFLDRIFALPRFARILLVIVPALALTFIISPIVDAIYLTFFYTPQTAEIPAWITAGFAIAMYFAGWFFVVGYAGEEPFQRREARWYLLVSAGVMALAVMWFIILTIQNITGAAD